MVTYGAVTATKRHSYIYQGVQLRIPEGYSHGNHRGSYHFHKRLEANTTRGDRYVREVATDTRGVNKAIRRIYMATSVLVLVARGIAATRYQNGTCDCQRGSCGYQWG